MRLTESIYLEKKNTEGVVIQLMDLKRYIEKLNLRFGFSTVQIGKHLSLHERSVKKLMEIELTKERSEI